MRLLVGRSYPEIESHVRKYTLSLRVEPSPPREILVEKLDVLVYVGREKCHSFLMGYTLVREVPSYTDSDLASSVSVGTEP